MSKGDLQQEGRAQADGRESADMDGVIVCGQCETKCGEVAAEERQTIRRCLRLLEEVLQAPRVCLHSGGHAVSYPSERWQQPHIIQTARCLHERSLAPTWAAYRRHLRWAHRDLGLRSAHSCA